MIFPFFIHSMDLFVDTIWVAMYDKCIVDENVEKDFFI